MMKLKEERRIMTNEEMSLEALKLCKKTRIFIPSNEYLDTAIESLEENTKLKAEIEQLKEEVNANKLWADVVERTLKKEIDKNTKLCEEIVKLRGDKNETKHR